MATLAVPMLEEDSQDLHGTQVDWRTLGTSRCREDKATGAVKSAQGPATRVDPSSTLPHVL